MGIREQLAVRHGRANADLVLAYVATHPEGLPELIDCLQSDDPVCGQCAAMVWGDLARLEPDWMRPHLPRLTELALHPPYPTTRRNVMRYFSEVPASWLLADEERVAGPLLELAFALAEDPTQKVTARMYGIQIAANLSEHYPELRPELRDLIEGELAAASPGFRSRARKILKGLV